MKINAVISKPSVKINSVNKSAITSAIMIVVGIIVGSIIYLINKDDLVNSLFDYFISFSMDFSHKNKPEILSGIILSNIPYFIIMLVLGTSAVGTPGIFALTVVKSMGLGMLTTYIYDSFSLKGIEYCLLVTLPGKFILIFAMILATQNSFMTSDTIRESLISKEGRVVSLNKFLLRSIFILFLILLSALVDFIAIVSFSSLFNFT